MLIPYLNQNTNSMYQITITRDGSRWQLVNTEQIDTLPAGSYTARYIYNGRQGTTQGGAVVIVNESRQKELRMSVFLQAIILYMTDTDNPGIFYDVTFSRSSNDKGQTWEEMVYKDPDYQPEENEEEQEN